MYMSRHVQSDDFFNKEFSDPSGIVLAVPQEVLHASLTYQASSVAARPETAPASDVAAVLNGAQGFFNAIASDPLTACALAVVILAVLGLCLSRLQGWSIRIVL